MIPAHVPEAVVRQLRTSAVLVGYSGGLDSTVLLHWLSATTGLCAAGLRALHVHHGLHGDADRWAEHCREACHALGVPLEVVRVEVPVGHGHGPEGAARHARHAAFASALREGEVLALAHHRDDQAETFLLRALRGSGPDGLSAMAPWRPYARGWLWRPLLSYPREELLAYATRHGLRWIDDPSNADVAFDRNFLRQRIMPLLRERWPHAAGALARSAELCGEAVELLRAEDAAALAQARTADPHVLSRNALSALAPARRARLLRRWIEDLGLPPLTAEGVRRIEDDLLGARNDAAARFAWHGAEVRAWRDLLRADRERSPLPDHWSAEWTGRVPLELPDGSTLSLEGDSGLELAPPLTVHARRGGERIVLPGRSHSHALKHVLQELGVPPWIRERLPLLSDASGHVHAAGDLVFSAEFDQWLRSRHARLAWRS